MPPPYAASRSLASRSPASHASDSSVPHPAKPWTILLARLGYAAKGVTYLIVGGLAVKAAWGAGGQTTGSTGALRSLVDEPFGQILVGVLALGLLGYAIHRFVQAIWDPDDKGTDGQGIVHRVYLAVSGLIHLSLAVAGAEMVTGAASSGGSGSTQSRTAELMAEPFGRWLVGIGGVIVVIVALRQFWRAKEADFMDKLGLDGLVARHREWVRRFGRFGIAARGVVFLIMGSFFVVAAWRASAAEAKGLEGALDTLGSQPYGPWLLGVVALGLVAYGIHQFVKARYRRIRH